MTEYRNKVLQGDCRETLKTLPDGIVQTCITSPPYWGLRSYLPKGHPLKDKEIGSEKTPELYIEHLLAVFREVHRVMRDDGTLWMNLGDSYAGGGPHHGDKNLGKSGTNKGCAGTTDRFEIPGLKPKDLCGIPWRLAFALQNDGWYLRSAIVWAKGVSFCKTYSGSVMPESVRGWTWQRHYVRQDEYERTRNRQKAAACKRKGGKIPQDGKVQGGSGPLSQQREGQGDNEGIRPDAECYGAQEAVCGFGARTRNTTALSANGERETERDEAWRQVPQNGQGAGDVQGGGQETGNPAASQRTEEAIAAHKICDGPRMESAGRPATCGMAQNANGQGILPGESAASPGIEDEDDRHAHDNPMAGDSGGVSGPVRLLWSDTEKVDDGPRCSVESERGTLNPQHRSGVSIMQLSEEGDDLDSGASQRGELIPCPGCAKCEATGGYVLRRGSWRPTSAYEMVFLFAKSECYFADGEGVKEESIDPESLNGIRKRNPPTIIDHDAGYDGHRTAVGIKEREGSVYRTRNLRNVWTINPQPFSGAHYATFPEALVEPCIKAGTSERGQCCECGAPWVRVVERGDRIQAHWEGTTQNHALAAKGKHGATSVIETGSYQTYRTTGWRPSCSCDAGESVPQIVLDPFGGSGTVGQVAYRLGRDYILCELNPDYLKHVDARMEQEAMPLFHKPS